MAMSDDFGEMLIGALEEAVAYKQGKLPDLRVDRHELTARHTTVLVPPRYDAARVRQVRTRMKVSQPVFAGMLNVSPSTVQAWEQGVREPDGASLRLLQIAEDHPDTLLASVMTPEAAASASTKRR
jgi:putative transcriptional regulator